MKIMCLPGPHNFGVAHSNPDGKLVYCIYECTRCSKAIVSDPCLGGFFAIMNSQAAIERDASKAVLRDQR
ncbi:hypothetical protein BV360_05584 [Pseudomonas syringae pv. actinidiae]|uniref:Acetate kinase n=1 Tax=Pseudomonas syringae pv. actinidiae TaxID=103796 RepID=A0AAN4Q2C7_PSESF|nr:hypothetical protein IYO_008115 [Pseudomonas syringae pv. actinidiae ICMP 18884]AOE55963.1 hypothetical protein NZ708_08105 [Pseudomonas syringae pv. actinidiae ICMP 18708]APP96929.1 hypothetical protein PsaNZ45_08660 [Pseudomonas syringae pv. actinidiae]AYL80144.1 hypothetical protein CN228_09370 [Pseudomonas syringae pv. actinidiae str. Shaanxi_M228]EPM65220.1 hypothetical protein A3SM_34090 [Pseudomonas syringae pv. actinidiae ICMP 18886]EPN65227.1 hypothetical protein A234_34366 [Pseudo